MKTKTLFSLATAVLLSGQTYAQTSASTGSSTTSTAKSSSFFKKLQDSPLSLTYLNDTGASQSLKEGTTENYNFTGVTTLNIAYLGYKITDTDSIRLENRLQSSFSQGASGKTKWARTVLKYSKSGLLTQADNGINLSAAIEKRYLPQSDDRNASNTYGLNRFSVSASKTLTDGLSLANTFYIALYDKRRDIENSTNGSNYFYNVTSLGKEINDKLSLTVIQELIHVNAENKDKLNAKGEVIQNTSQADYTIDLSYNLNDKVSASVYTGATLFTSNDQSTFAANWYKQYSLGAALSVSVF